MDDFTKLDSFPIFRDFIRVPKDNMTLLEAPILQGQARDEHFKVDELQKAINRLKLFRAHDALVLLKNSISIPKLLYLLRTSHCYNHPLLLQFDTILKSGLQPSSILISKRSMDPGNSTSERCRTGYKMCEHAGNISISGLCCVNAHLQTVYFTIVIQPSTIPSSGLNRGDMELAFVDLHRRDEVLFPSKAGAAHPSRCTGGTIANYSRGLTLDSGGLPSPVSTVFLLLFVKFRLPASDAQLKTVNKSSNLYLQNSSLI